MQRPAEITTFAGALAYLIAYLLDRMDNPDLLVALAVVIGGIPGIVTFAVNAHRKRANASRGEG